MDNSPKQSEFTGLSFSPPGSSAWTSSFFSFAESSKPEPDLFGFQDHEEPCNYIISDSQFNEPLYTMEDHLYDPSQQILVDPLVKQEPDPICTEEFESQDLSAVTSIGKPPIIISQNDNCCVVLESSAMDNDVKEYFSL
ncbi:hypothetical protein J6590_024561 [Homalodisca vitripennis]|nr:hypothetical protein J6590_024561 [Homalodisca vitripennis]